MRTREEAKIAVSVSNNRSCNIKHVLDCMRCSCEHKTFHESDVGALPILRKALTHRFVCLEHNLLIGRWVCDCHNPGPSYLRNHSGWEWSAPWVDKQSQIRMHESCRREQGILTAWSITGTCAGGLDVQNYQIVMTMVASLITSYEAFCEGAFAGQRRRKKLFQGLVIGRDEGCIANPTTRIVR